VLRLLEAEPARRYQIAILDPPYAEHAILAPLESLVPLLDDDAVVVVKHFWRTEVPPVTGLRIRRVRRFGETSLTFLATDGDGQT
jgi:16S rRNA G966 N2-methylase RsmD